MKRSKLARILELGAISISSSTWTRTLSAETLSHLLFYTATEANLAATTLTVILRGEKNRETLVNRIPLSYFSELNDIKNGTSKINVDGSTGYKYIAAVDFGTLAVSGTDELEITLEGTFAGSAFSKWSENDTYIKRYDYINDSNFVMSNVLETYLWKKDVSSTYPIQDTTTGVRLKRMDGEKVLDESTYAPVTAYVNAYADVSIEIAGKRFQGVPLIMEDEEFATIDIAVQCSSSDYAFIVVTTYANVSTIVKVESVSQAKVASKMVRLNKIVNLGVVGSSLAAKNQKNQLKVSRVQGLNINPVIRRIKTGARKAG